jgi:hypothetical protein
MAQQYTTNQVLIRRALFGVAALLFSGAAYMFISPSFRHHSAPVEQASTFKPAKAWTGMWYMGLDACGSGPNAQKCVLGVNETESYVSKARCESAAQMTTNSMRSILMVVKRAWCEQR